MSNQKKIVNWISQKSLRLPNVAFTLCKPTAKLLRYDTECNVPGSHHMFIVPLDYNKIQITNYLQQLYNIQRPLSVHTEIKFGGSRPNPCMLYITMCTIKCAYDIMYYLNVISFVNAHVR